MQPNQRVAPWNETGAGDARAAKQFAKAKKLFTAREYLKAEQLTQALLLEHPAEAGLLSMMGGILLETGRAAGAVPYFQRAILADPRQAEGFFYLGQAQESAGENEAALQSYTHAAMLKKNYAKPNLRAAQLLQRLSRDAEALPYVIRACVAAPREYTGWHLYAGIQNTLPLYEEELLLREPLQQILREGFNYYIPACIIRQLRLTPWLRGLKDLFQQRRLADIDRIMTSRDALREMNDPLLLELMRRSPVSNILLESTLTRLRRVLLLTPNLAETAEARPLLLALWAHGFLNEYVYYTEAEETARVNDLRAEVAAAVESGVFPPFAVLALLGSYTPLWREAFAEKLLALPCPDPEIAALLKAQIGEMLADRTRMSAIPQLCPIQDDITLRVREQYEENPYPRWSELPAYDVLSLGEYMERSLLQPHWQPLPKEPLQVLVAGCGTGQHAAILARILPNARILAVDISLASLAYAQRKAEQFGFNNIEFLQADILDLDKLGRSFDMIESMGVLHHMREPMAGWQVLTRLLRPGGAMKIGLYSQIARMPITLARQEIAARKLGHSDDAIRTYRHELMQRIMDSHHPLPQESEGGKLAPHLARIFMGVDFYTLSNCRDLLFHVQEHQFTFPQIGECVEKLGLNYLGLSLEKHSKTGRFQAALPEHDRRGDFAAWHGYEQQHPETFLGMINFWLQKPRG